VLVLYNVNVVYIVEDCAKMGSQFRRKKKSSHKHSHFVEEEMNEKRRIGNHNWKQASHENQQNIMDTTIEETQDQISNISS